jgi:hypothetical protein
MIQKKFKYYSNSMRASGEAHKWGERAGKFRKPGSLTPGEIPVRNAFPLSI